jgi:hypothetical protein
MIARSTQFVWNVHSDLSTFEEHISFVDPRFVIVIIIYFDLAPLGQRTLFGVIFVYTTIQTFVETLTAFLLLTVAVPVYTFQTTAVGDFQLLKPLQ